MIATEPYRIIPTEFNVTTTEIGSSTRSKNGVVIIPTPNPTMLGKIEPNRTISDTKPIWVVSSKIIRPLDEKRT